MGRACARPCSAQARRLEMRESLKSGRVSSLLSAPAAAHRHRGPLSTIAHAHRHRARAHGTVQMHARTERVALRYAPPRSIAITLRAGLRGDHADDLPLGARRQLGQTDSRGLRERRGVREPLRRSAGLRPALSRVPEDQPERDDSEHGARRGAGGGVDRDDGIHRCPLRGAAAAAFACSVVTGTLMFMSNATGYYDNAALRVKMLLLLLAGLNMLYFQKVIFRGVSRWDLGRPPVPARLAFWRTRCYSPRVISAAVTNRGVISTGTAFNRSSACCVSGRIFTIFCSRARVPS